MIKPRYALITGANGGIGKALCTAFSDEGYHVIATDKQDAACSDLDFKKYIVLNLSDYVNNEQYAANKNLEISEALPSHQLHCLLNNAAIQILGSVNSLTRSDWHTTLNVNLQAPFFLTQSLLPQLENAKGSVVNISSIHAKLTKPNFVAYATSKAALSALTRSMAVDLGPRVRVNAIEPAAVATDMLKAGFNGKPELLTRLENYHPVKRIGEPHEISQLAVFLASDKSKFIQGSCIDISGSISNSLHDPIFEA
ncbi:SDR family NAD(P)-dependent oxidoreductase [Psychrobacter pygoscelis]|uniref:SDR family NAD(P)-dependent oxidoreductase n=1 Tax=Psychrobacter pygoscelis TaxID=2488563 RepID=UPI00103C661A|nr:SDR family oxidoreductase [Psychrobacter pygoscelis]